MPSKMYMYKFVTSYNRILHSLINCDQTLILSGYMTECGSQKSDSSDKKKA